MATGQIQLYDNQLSGKRSLTKELNLLRCKYEDRNKSALSMHAYEHHRFRFSIDNYRFAILKECNPRSLNREEFRFIEKYRTNCLGLNRCKVER